MKRYEKYKDSGVRWIGEIPEHWQVKRLKYVKSDEKNSFVDGPFGSNLKTEHFLDEGDVYVIDSGYVTSGKFEFHREYKMITNEHFETVNRSECKENDIIISKIGANFGMSGILPKLDKSSLVSGNTLKLTVNREKYNLNFIHTQLLNLKQLGEIDLLVKGSAQPALSMGAMSDLPFLVPESILEQTAIANYLDKKTTELDTLITKKERLIELLQEERTAIINQAVTKGLDPDVEMKDSQIEWLGEIPAHWEVKKLKYLVKDLLSGVSVNSEDNPVDGSEEIGILKTSCVYDFSFRPNENKKVLKEEYDRVRCPVTKDSIIISRMNTPDLVGACGYVDLDYDNLYLPDRLWKTTFFEDASINVKYLYTILISDLYKQTISSKATGTSSSMKNISKDDFLTMPIPFPPLVEQIEIRDFMENKKFEFDVVISKTNQEITLLKEYKTALISEVVTGKVKVI